MNNTPKENNKFRSFSIGARVTAAEKKLYQEMAARLGFTMSEFVSAIMQMHYDKYDSYGKPTEREIELEKQIHAQELEIKRLKKNSQKDYESASFFKSQRDKLERELAFLDNIVKSYKLMITPFLKSPSKGI